MPHPAPGWFDRLPATRCVAEFSLWSADLCNMASELERIAPHADILHIDVADGVFAPALLFFPDFVSAIRARSNLPLHVHLMVDDAILLPQIQQFAESGADLITIHAESSKAQEAIGLVRSHGMLAGAVLRVESPLDLAARLLSDVSMVTLLGTAIGVKGQGLSETAPGRIAAMRGMTAGSRHRMLVAADGGIRDDTVPRLVSSGAQTVVLGSLAFAAPDIAQRMSWLHALPVS